MRGRYIETVHKVLGPFFVYMVNSRFITGNCDALDHLLMFNLFTRTKAAGPFTNLSYVLLLLPHNARTEFYGNFYHT